MTAEPKWPSLTSRTELLAFVRAASVESVALLVAAVCFALGFAVTVLLFWGSELSITGIGSAGFVAAVGSAIVAVIGVHLGRLYVRPADHGRHRYRDGLAMPGDRLRWYDMFSILAAYASIALLGWQGIALLIEQAFTGAPVYAVPAALLVSTAFAITAYVTFLSSVALNPLMLSFVLAVFLVVGAFTSMINASDPRWWELNLSILGATDNQSAWVFNTTLIIAGVIVTTVARYATADLPVATRAQRRARALVRTGLVTVGILLACVGIFPVDLFVLIHNIVASGMVVVFVALMVAMPWLIPALPRVFHVVGYVFTGVIVMLVVFHAVGYYNLTALELVSAMLVFAWIILFLRTSPAAQREPSGPGG